MLYARQAQNCCAEVQALLGCPAVGPCRGVEGNCGDLPSVFADTPVPPYFPNGLQDYTCIQFPDDNSPRDSIIVALIALAVAIPVSVFLQSCFEIANDSEAPESWLFYGGVVKLACGLQAHRRWHYTRGKQPSRFVRWYCRSVDAPKPETIENLYHAAVSWITGRKPPWTVEAEEAAKAEEAEEEVLEEKPSRQTELISAAVERADASALYSSGAHGNGDASDSPLATEEPDEATAPHYVADPDSAAVDLGEAEAVAHPEHGDGDVAAGPVSVSVVHVASEATGSLGYSEAACLGEEVEESEQAESEASFASAAELQASKRRLTAFGLAGVWLVWAIFSWFIFTYGMLIYKLLGEGAESAFASSWGVSYGVGAAAEWKVRVAVTIFGSSDFVDCAVSFAQDIGKEAAKAAVILVILERLHLTSPVAWLEARALGTCRRAARPLLTCGLVQEHLDYLSVQALLFESATTSLVQQTRMFVAYRSRICDS